METTKKRSVFDTLNAINVNEHAEKKGNLTYLSWAWAWQEVKKAYPDATYTIYENQQGWNYFTDGRTCWVKTGVTINGIEHIEYLPVMDNRNNSLPLERVTSFSVNTAIQRSLTKACARHGLGLYIYAGEDLPQGEAEAQAAAKKEAEDKYLSDALAAVESSTTSQAVKDLWSEYKSLQTNAAFKQAVINRGKQLQQNEAATNTQRQTLNTKLK